MEGQPEAANLEPPPSAPAVEHAPVVVIGAGFAGLEVARELGRAGISVTLIDRQNHHLFQPLLYQVAAAALAAPDVAEPIRKNLRAYRSVTVWLGEVTAIDWRQRRLRFANGEQLGYDRLVLAAGARTSYFGHDEWAPHAPGLKTIDDARRIRSRLLLAFERAERTSDPEERARLMTVAVIGGGPTGVEMSGAIAELSRFTLARDFRNIRPEATRVLLIEGGERLLPGFHPALSAYALQRLKRLGVTVMLDSMVGEVRDDAVIVEGERLPVGLVVWGAGVAASPLAPDLGAETDETGRLIVRRTLEVPGRPGVFALGDIAHCPDEQGEPLPGLAQVAKQQGTHLGRALAAEIRKGTPLPAFTYRSRGNTAIVGRHAAVFETGRTRLTGWPAWALWAVVHVYLLVGFQNRVLVTLQWLWRYLTYERGARLITPAEVEPPRRR